MSRMASSATMKPPWHQEDHRRSAQSCTFHTDNEGRRVFIVHDNDLADLIEHTVKVFDGQKVRLLRDPNVVGFRMLHIAIC